MKKYYLIYGWNLKDNSLMKPIIKETTTDEIWILNLPIRTDMKLVKCYCSKDKEEIDKMIEKSYELFCKGKVTYKDKIILNMEKLCKMQEERINGEWITEGDWTENEMPF